MARAGRFGTKGLAITFVSDETDAKTLNDVQDRFEVNVAELPEEIDISSYSMFYFSHISLQTILHIYIHHIYTHSFIGQITVYRHPGITFKCDQA